MRHRTALVGAGAAVLLLLGAAFLLPALLGDEVAAFKIFVHESRVYRVSYEDLKDAGWHGGSVRAEGLGLTQGGEPVPIWVEDHGDDRFGAGDWIEFVGERLAGETSYYDEIAPLNVYRLDLQAEEGQIRMQELSPPADATVAGIEPYRSSQHFEKNRLLMRFQAHRRLKGQELWYWVKLTHLDAEPFRVLFDFDDLRETGPIRLRAHLRGWSSRPRQGNGGPADHLIELLVNDVPVAQSEWFGQSTTLVEAEVPRHLLQSGEDVISFRVPRRTVPENGETLIDVVLLNWLEVSYPRGGAVSEVGQTTLSLDAADAPPVMSVSLAHGCDATLYGTDGTRIGASDLLVRARPGGEGVQCLFRPPPLVASGDGDLLVVPEGAHARPVGIERDLPSDLAGHPGADYLMIAHPTLMAAVEPLARFHRDRGLQVTVADVRDVYDEFNHGIPHPKAIKDYISYAYHNGVPRPRFVLLVGDASWDPHNDEAVDPNYTDWTYRPGETERFVKNTSTPYAELAGANHANHRNMVPTWNYDTREGHAAADNWFVSVDGDDFYPDLAIGRFPVTVPEEAARIVAKTIGYASSEVGPWRRSLLWVTNEQRQYQAWSDELSAAATELGFSGARLYPQPDEADNLEHQAQLRAELSRGNLLVHFVGHGGRYIWRTGPPDHRKNHDLFTLDDLDQLEPGSPLSVVLAMTCYSAPFDHPVADSIGEKFLRLEDAGAVGVVAASWRNYPTKDWSRALTEELLAGGPIGESVRRAKLRIRNPTLVETYNLLGDPAVPLALPQLDVAVSAGDADAVRVEIDDRDFRGRALVEWLGADDQVVDRVEREVASAAFTIPFSGDEELLDRVRRATVYVWSPERRVDGLGVVTLTAADPEPTAALAAGHGG